MGKTANRVLLHWRKRARGADDRQQIVGAPDSGKLLRPVVPAEGPAAGVEGALHQLAGEPRVRTIEAISLTAEKARVEGPISDVRPGGDQKAGSRRRDLRPIGIRTDDLGAIRIRNVEVAGAKPDRHQGQRQTGKLGNWR